MFCYQESVSKGTPKPCTVEKWNQLINSSKVINICRQIASLDPAAEDYNDRKQALKKKLPIIIPHASAFTNGKRISADAVPSGLAMLDVDHVPDPRAWFETLPRELLIENRIFLVAITASGQGLRIIGARQPGEPIEAAQLRMAESLGISEYDAVTKDLARASYVVPRSYILWLDSTELFSARDCAETLPLRQGESPQGEGVDPSRVDSSETDSTVSKAATSPNLGEELNSDSETYRGIPYSDIVEELLLQTGNAGGVVQGERNTVYFSMANYMRYICDFNKELLFRVLPDFGLPEQERLQAITSALGRPRKNQMPVIVQSAVANCQRQLDLLGDDKLKLPKAADMAMPRLPKLLKILCRKLPASYRPAMIIASLPVLGTLATRIRFKYLDNQEQSLSFFSCITAPAASGKSFIRKPIDLLLTPINEQDRIEREKEQQYKEKLRASKNSKFQPEDPHACPRNNGVAISVSKLLQLLTYAEGKHLIGIGEEMDTLVKSEKAGTWSQKSDIYRMAFDNAEYGQAYMSDQSFNAHVRVYYNLLLTGTPNSMKRFFKDLEDGLATRVCFAQLPDTSFSDIPVFESYTEEEQAEVIRWSRKLDTEQGTIECQVVTDAISGWLKQRLQDAIDADNHAMDVLRRRAAVIGFRAGMLCYLLEDRRATALVGQFATWVAEYVFRNQMELWGEKMEQVLTSSLEEQNERGAATSLLGLLPKEFTTTDLIQLRAKKGQSVNTQSIKMLLYRWKKTRRISRIGEGHWKQLR